MRLKRADLRVPDAQADLYLVGLGIGGFDRRSVEADQILRDSRRILHLTAYDSDLRLRYDGEVTDLEQVYAADPNPGQVYHAMAARVLEAAAEGRGHGPVSFLTYGHPLFLVDTGWLLQEAAQRHGLTVKAVPATSFLDTLLIDVGARFDYAVQAYDANAFYLHSVVPDTRFPLVLSQFGSFGTDRLRDREDLYGRLSPLTARLRDLYPADRAVAAVLSAWRSDMAPQISHATVGELDSLVSSSHSGMTLYIGGSEPWTLPRTHWND
ncbi:SAM-dependent methyltransferase [Kitasatospora sp. NPDC056731]|uniref:SAM-dependent methyltransferase n=1 Tax=Kitasatospora sp. NPDC056731 TaxID=3155422 RepID=UPI003442C010